MAEVKRSGAELLADVSTADPPRGTVAFWWMGQASYIFKGGGSVVYLDPYLSPSPARQTPPLLAPSEAANADVVLCTHDHSDHIDEGALPGIAEASPGAVFVVPRPHVDRLQRMGIAPARITGLTDWETCAVGDLRITGIKAKHEFFEEQPGVGFPYLGYLLEMNGVRLYHSGDTVPYDGLIATLRGLAPDGLFLPINGRDAKRYLSGCIGNCTFQEAVDIAGEVAAPLAVPMHWDMFAANSEDPQRFVDYLQAKYPGIATWVGAAGERAEVRAR